MDEDTSELIARLYTQIGMIMEDASIIALELGGEKIADSGQAHSELKQASEKISSLLAAANALSE